MRKAEITGSRTRYLPLSIPLSSTSVDRNAGITIPPNIHTSRSSREIALPLSKRRMAPRKRAAISSRDRASQGPVPPPQPEGQGDQAGRRRRVDIHSIVVGHLGGPQQLKGRPRGDACQQYREKDGRQKEQTQKTAGANTTAERMRVTISQIPPNRRARL